MSTQQNVDNRGERFPQLFVDNSMETAKRIHISGKQKIKRLKETHLWCEFTVDILFETLIIHLSTRPTTKDY